MSLHICMHVVSPLSLQFDITTPRNGVTGGSRLYLRAMVEINETKARTRDGMRCFLSRGRSQNGRIRLYVRAHQDTEAVPTTSLANRVASFRVLAAVKRRFWGVHRLTLALFPTILNWKGNVARDCDVDRSWRKLETRRVDKDVISRKNSCNYKEIDTLSTPLKRNLFSRLAY